jgi:acetoin utilization deacetylase AcuC-like enzyme
LFKPDFIFVSAGFDAHLLDQLHRSNASQLTELDYHWVTHELLKFANTYSKGRLVSVLEGGYNTKAWAQSPLAQSVLVHVKALLDGTRERAIDGASERANASLPGPDRQRRKR